MYTENIIQMEMFDRRSLFLPPQSLNFWLLLMEKLIKGKIIFQVYQNILKDNVIVAQALSASIFDKSMSCSHITNEH